MTEINTKWRTQKQVVAMFKKRGLGNRQARIGSAIAMCEAPVDEVTPEPMCDFGLLGDLELMNEKWGPSVGGLQIRSEKAATGTGGLRDIEVLKFPGKNVDAAVTIFRSQGWDPWTTFTSGKYKAYLQDLFPPPANTYVVLANEFLSTIAPKLAGDPWNTNITWQELARLNNIKGPNYTIYIGQALLYK